MGKKITVVFLIYNDASYVPGLVKAIQAQRNSNYLNQSDWLEVLFMDNGSTDDTAHTIQRELQRIGSPSHYQLEVNPQNMGISRALNKAFQMVTTPYVLTCHCDVLFGQEDYVAKIVDFLDRYPKAAAITGQPAISVREKLPLAEKINFIANMMDIFPASSKDELVPVGFAESRCDGFRVEALKTVGYYDTTLRLAGEDQIMASRLRAAGYEIYQSPQLTYYLSVSNDQNSLSKLLKHTRLFGRAHPYILMKNPGTGDGVLGKKAGGNRQARMILRALQILSTWVYFLVFFGLLTQSPAWVWGIPLLGILISKTVLFFPYFRAISLSLKEYFIFFGFQVLLDISYTMGLFQGLWVLRSDLKTRSIS